MWYLIGEISVYLVTGMLIGGVTGCLFRRGSCRRDLDQLHMYWTGRARALDHERARMRDEAERAHQRAVELDGTLQEKLAALQRLAVDLRKAERRVRELEAEAGEVDRKLEISAAQPAQLEAKIAELRSQLAEREGYIRQLEPLGDRLDTASRRIVELEREHEATLGEMRRLQQDHDRTNRIIAELQLELAGSANGKTHTNGQEPATYGHSGGGEFKDDLKQIRGIGPVLEQALNRIGVYTFEQIATWTPAEIERVSDQLEGAQGRIHRDRWVVQARQLTRQHV